MRPRTWHRGRITHHSLLCWLSRDSLLFHNSSSSGFLNLRFPRWSFFSLFLLLLIFKQIVKKLLWSIRCWGNTGRKGTVPGTVLLQVQSCQALSPVKACKGHFHHQCPLCKMSQYYMPPSQGKEA